MARYTGPVCRQCRREGKKLFLKGDRCFSDKCAFARRQYAPGEHGKGRSKLTEYGLQLRAKQMTRRYYGVLEGQFRHYYELAEKKPGKTGEELLSILESRLDNVVYRLGFASSRAEARQLVVHGHFTVNGRRVDIPSFLVKPGDVVAISEKAKKNAKFKELLEGNTTRTIVKWLDLNRELWQAKVLDKAKREDIELEVEETLIVELYSK